jgi:hypothetical protein
VAPAARSAPRPALRRGCTADAPTGVADLIRRRNNEVKDTTLAGRAELKSAIYADAGALLRAIARLRQEHRAAARALADAQEKRARIAESIARLRAIRRDLKRKTR